jgi:hypothetical protein
MNTWLQKIGFCAHTCPPDCACPIRRDPPWLKSGKRLGRRALAQVASVAKPDTILAWFRKLIAYKFDGSKYRRYPGRPRIEPKLESLIVQMAKENSGWGYDRIVGALANLGYKISDQTVGNVLSETGLRQRRSGARPRLGRNLFNRIGRCWPGSTSSRSK